MLALMDSQELTDWQQFFLVRHEKDERRRLDRDQEQRLLGDVEV